MSSAPSESEISDCRMDNSQLQLYETAMAASSCGIVISDATQPDNPIIYCNPAFEKMTGYSRSDILGTNCRILQGADTDPAALAHIRASVRAGQECQVVIKNYRKDGTPFWNDLRISPVRNAQGNVTNFIGVQTDITERLLAEDNARLMQFSLEQIGDPAFWIAPTGKFFYVNAAACNLLGYAREELLSMSMLDIDPDFPTATWLQPWQAIKQLCSFTIETRYRTKQGQILPVEVTLNYAKFHGQEYYCAFARDISQRKQAEAEMQRRNALLKAQQEASLNGIIVTDADKNITSYNHRFCEMWQVPQALMQPRKEQELRAYLLTLLPVQGQDAIAKTEAIYANPQACGCEEVHLKDGRTFERYTAPVLSPQGEYYGRLWSFRDITERKIAERKLRSAAEREHLVSAIATRIRRSLNLQTVLDTAVNEVRKVLHTDRVLLYRLEADGSGTVVVESVGQKWQAVVGSNFRDDCFLKKYLQPYQKGRVHCVEDIYTANLQPCYVEFLANFQVRANLVVPVLHGDNLWGMLIAHHCRSSRRWKAGEIRMLKQLSVQLAIALQQAELYQHLETELAERRAAEAALRASESQLRQKTTQLETTLSQLKQAQTQLIQSEKMSSLGQLVAGVAHEINNPVTFITGNLDHASQYTQDLLTLLQLYRQHSHPDIPEIQAQAEEMDLDFIIQDFPKLLDSMTVGADRIRQIILSLKNFSRLDEAECKLVDIHEGIDNTLMILQHRLRFSSAAAALTLSPSNKQSIEVIKNYGNLPLIECYPGQLNQVFMNLLSNAIDALEEALVNCHWSGDNGATAPHPQIKISTEIPNNQQVVIRIADNGAGMSETVLNRIFDPFFTTKPVGKGTGLGLSICYQIIVEKHGGKLQCHSQPSQGSEFVIEIPCAQIPKHQSHTLIPSISGQVASTINN